MRFLTRAVTAGWLGVAALIVAVLTSGPMASMARADAALTVMAPGIAYQPRGYRPENDDDPALVAQIIDDLRLLRKAGFRSLVTYGAEGALGAIPQLAREAGFDGTIVMGVWDPLSEAELVPAAAAGEFVDGYAVGNEGLGLRYDTEELARAMLRLRGMTGRPVTTTEPIDSYLNGPYREWLLANSDWLFPLAHPFWATQVDPVRAAQWIIVRHDYLVASTGRPVALKEVGFPTWCEQACSERQQTLLFEELEAARIPFFYFEAFDQPWKPEELRLGRAEAHWGLFDSRGQPKAIVAWLQERYAE